MHGRANRKHTDGGGRGQTFTRGPFRLSNCAIIWRRLPGKVIELLGKIHSVPDIWSTLGQAEIDHISSPRRPERSRSGEFYNLLWKNMHLRMRCMHRNGLAGVIVTDSATERTKGGILEMPSVTERERGRHAKQNKYGRRVAASGSFGGSGIGTRESSVTSHSPRWQT